MCLSVLTVQISDKIKMENVATSFYKNLKRYAFCCGKVLFQALNHDKNFKKILRFGTKLGSPTRKLLTVRGKRVKMLKLTRINPF